MPPLLAEIDWNTLLQQDPGLPFLAAIGMIMIVALTAIIAVQWRKANQLATEARLKELMIQRGFSAQEIVDVIGVKIDRRQTEQPHCPDVHADPVGS